MVAKTATPTNASPAKAKAKAKGVAKDLPPKRCQGMDIDRFYAFSQCSIKMEASHFFKHDVTLQDPLAQRMWPHFEKMALRNLGKNEKWVPFHTVLGVHEQYLCTDVHHANEKTWSGNEYRCFVLMMIFRAHCKRELFELQLPFLNNEAFWKDPKAAFDTDSPMHQAIKVFRAAGNALQTSCFLIIPERLVPDDNENIIKNLLLRSQRLIALADDLWQVVNDQDKTTAQMYEIIQEKIEKTRGLGETWVKMLMVVIDIARPNMGLLQDRCPVGGGASDPLRTILEDEGILQPKEKKDRKEKTGKYEIVPFAGTKCEIMVVKKDAKQLLQVTQGSAGSLDRAHAIAQILCDLANKGEAVEAIVEKKKTLLSDQTLKVPKMGFDARQPEMMKAKEQRIIEREGPSPTDGLVILRDRIVKAACGPSGKHFTNVLRSCEGNGAQHFKALPLVARQFHMAERPLSCATLQVQLCEFRQFNNFLKTIKENA